MQRKYLMLATLAGIIFSTSGNAKDNTKDSIKDDAKNTLKDIVYQQHVKPIFDKKCVVCHACFDAPCQLVLTHGKGLFRGANKQPIYDSLRLTPADTTRLFIDADSEHQWREKDFFSVLPEKTNTTAAVNASILEQLLLMGQKNKIKPNSRLPEDTGIGLSRKNVCPTAEEISDYEQTHPHGGMPLGVVDLTNAERQTLLDWIKQGAVYTPDAAKLSTTEQQAVQLWEQYLNRKGLREQIVARWLYEHLFLAHLHFSDANSKQFFQVVRSSTPPGKTIRHIATRRPNDDPGKSFFYRLQPVQETIVHKTHIVFTLNKQRLEDINQLFFNSDWKIDRLPGYTDAERANPFQTFAPIPASARYGFMLAHAAYFVQTYIRGPVCRGQIATDVIRDQFWVLFQAPQSDLYVTSANYRKRATPLMDIAGVEQDLLDGAKTWMTVKDQYMRYTDMRQAAYDHNNQTGATFADIWRRDGTDKNVLLTVFRHYDNASVSQGLIGDDPLTLWWLDYPLFERGYYNLVVNFDVFGSVSHQAQTRLYFDLIRNDAERNFLRLMPAKSRQTLIDNWYEGAAQLKLLTSYQTVSNKKASGIRYKSDNPMSEFLDRLLNNVAENQQPDIINRRGNAQQHDFSGTAEHQNIQSLRRIVSQPANTLPAVKAFPEVSFIRVFNATGRKEIYTVFRHRKHSNVAFMFGESLRRKPDEDTLMLYPGILASYPNFIFNVSVDEIDTFVDALLAVKNEQAFEKNIITRWGVRRTHPRFWEYFHDLTAYLEERSPTEAGVLDMSRYENL